MDDCKRGFWGLSEFRCDGRSSAQHCGHRIPAAAPNLSRAHATPPAAPAADRRETSHVGERGDHKVEEHEEQICERRGRREHGEHVEQSRRGADLAGTDLAGWSGSG